MAEPGTWRELLETIISNTAERERIANEIGVRSITLTRWASGQSLPRPHNLRQLLNALQHQHRTQFLELIEEELPNLTTPIMDDSSQEIPYAFIMEVLDTRAIASKELRFWTISRLVLQQALRQLDPERIGMSITIVRCMPPCSDGKIHSLRESVGLGTPPWEGDLEPKALFLGAESLSGYVISSSRPASIGNLTTDATRLPAYQLEYEVSTAASPVLYANCIAGCLLLSSTLPNYFVSPSRLSLIHGYANLLALAFEPEEFYAPALIELHMMPPLDVQRTYFASFRQRVLEIMRRASIKGQPLSSIQAEELAWQELEEILLNLPPQTA